MGEPVTEEMMAEWERACDEAAQNNGREVRADVLAEDFDVPDAMRTLVAEVRRLRALDTRGYNVGFATGKHAGDAAGYARAERVRGGDCDEPYRRVTNVDAMASALVLRRLEELRDLLGDARVGATGPADEDRLRGLQRALDGARAKRARLVSLAADGVITRVELGSRLGTVDAELGHLEAAIAEEERRSRPVAPALRAEVLRDVARVRRAWQRISVPARRAVVALLAERIDLGDGAPRFTWASAESLCDAAVGRNLFGGTADSPRKARAS